MEVPFIHFTLPDDAVRMFKGCRSPFSFDAMKNVLYASRTRCANGEVPVSLFGVSAACESIRFQCEQRKSLRKYS